jgi:hypothetical protein
VALCATATLAVAGCGPGSPASSSSSAASASLTVWWMGASTPAQVTWMNGVVSRFHKACLATLTQISPLNTKNWSTAGQTDQIIAR